MFDGFTKPKFYTKCKALIKTTKTRLEALKKKKNTVAKYLKNDMADLIRTGLDYNAFCRAEGLLVEQNMIACYEFIEQFCGCISTNLSLMSKQKECPEECKEAVQSLMYAAARFSEFPELRDLRSLCTDKYGPALESFISKEFFELLKPKSTTKEMKLQLMHDIAQEFSIEWNSKSLEQKLFKPPPPPPPQQDQKHNADDEGYKQKKSKDDGYKKRSSLDDNDEYKWDRNENDALAKTNSIDSVNKLNDTRERDFADYGRKNATDDRYKLHSSCEDDVFSVSRRDSTDQDSILASSSSVGSVSEDEIDSKKPISYRFIPPPYFRTKVEKESKTEVPLKSAETDHRDDSIPETNTKPRSVRRRPLKPPPGREHVDSVERPLKPPPGRERVGSFGSDGSPRTNPSATNQEEPRRGSKILQADDDDQSNEEEKAIDGLLMRYSKKDLPQEPSNVNSYLKPPPSRPTRDDTGVSTRHRNAKSELPLPPGRGSSLGESTEAKKGHVRAVSAQPDAMSGRAHPSLPDYDELPARLAALRGR